MTVKTARIKKRLSATRCIVARKWEIGETVAVFEPLSSWRVRVVGVGKVVGKHPDGVEVKFKPVEIELSGVWAHGSCKVDLPVEVDLSDLTEPDTYAPEPTPVPNISPVQTCKRCGCISETEFCQKCLSLIRSENLRATVNEIIEKLATTDIHELIKHYGVALVGTAMVVSACGLSPDDAFQLSTLMPFTKLTDMCHMLKGNPDARLIATEVLLSYQLNCTPDEVSPHLKSIISAFGKFRRQPVFFSDLLAQIENSDDAELTLSDLVIPQPDTSDDGADDPISVLKLLLRDLVLRFVAPDLPKNPNPTLYKLAIFRTLIAMRDIIECWMADLEKFGS